MKFLVLYVSTFLSFTAWSFEYKIDQASLLNPSSLQIYKISQMLSANGFHSISDLNLTTAGFTFDRAFVSHQWQSSMILKSGLQVPDTMLGKVITDEGLGVQVLHFKVEETYYMLMGMDMTKGEFKEAAKPWITSSDVSAKFSWLLPQAHAVTCMTGPQNRVGKTADSLESDSILRAIGKCGTDALSGFTGSVSSTLSFFKRLATEPGKLWAETKQSFVELKNFVMNINSELKEAFAAFQSLPSEEKAAIACTIAGQVLGDAAQGLVGAGALAGLAKLLPSLLLKIKAGLKTVVQGLELRNKGLKIPDGSVLAREAMSCAL
ncbi:hypothetical protein AZI86_03480 [Bdellovibrio bacteriovorus]|uniref:Uncharacterized protein n=1 Tax=Bdellovibrio bacteriovorus TaxID=959 RepID=A0A150WP49_BDEBC|nr:hypothetical protein [Bdellovibrio bacteriovorus]KYG66136.1 hypothetical protein AZI86_03480 [Bdellovibrio bacteriovorus]